AVARAHRMGQIRTVRVHRLLATDSVDQRMLDILARKERLFDLYARRSDVAETTPDAVDVSDGTLARRIVEEEQQRLVTGAAGTDGEFTADTGEAEADGADADVADTDAADPVGPA
ncbi:ATP-dependent helicase, partial [Streptomyces sp. NPDC001274]